MLFVHLYSAEGDWIAQFQTAEQLEAYVADQGWNINDYEIRMEKSKYPK